MAQDDARRDLVEARIICRIDDPLRPVVGKWRVEIELPLIDQLQDGVGEDGFTKRCSTEAGAIGDRLASCGVDGAEAVDPAGAAILDEGNGEAGNVCLLHEAGNIVGECCDGLLRPCGENYGEAGKCKQA